MGSATTRGTTRPTLAPTTTSAVAAVGASGVEGTVTVGPTTPVCRQGQPCDAPAAADVVVTPDGGGPAVSGRSDANGRFRVSVGPGGYTVTARTDQARSCTPVHVTVVSGRYAHVDLQCDTGIR